MTLFLAVTAAALGALIGYGFGMMQRHALARNAAQEARGALKSGWTLMPGAGGRIAMFLLVLVLVQIVCPFLFENPSIPWVVSAGVVVGYGWTLVQKLKQGATLVA